MNHLTLRHRVIIQFAIEYDYIALKAGYVTITPLNIDLVNHQRLTSLADKWDDYFKL